MMRGKLRFILFALLSFILLQSQNVMAQSITVNADSTLQIIRGFGGMTYAVWIGELTADNQEKAFGNDPGQIGLSMLRIPVPSDSASFNRDLASAKYAQSKGAIVFASPWNPPSSMVKVLSQNESTTDYVLQPEFYDDYVGHLNSFIDYMNNSGTPLYAISMQNEPDWHGWTVWTPSQLLKFLKENASGINCKLIAPESLGYVRSTIDPLLKDSLANSEIDILGTHLYGTSKANYYYPLAYQKNKEIWMTEHLFGSDKPEDNTWDLALDIAEEINTCMDANFSAFVYWYIRRFYGLIDEAGNITDKGYVLSQFSKFIRPGSYRIGTKLSSASNVSATAFKNDSTLSIVVVNKNKSAVNFSINIENILAGIDSLTKFTTSATKKVVNDGTIGINGGSFAASVDANSITTFTSNAAQGGKYGNQPPVASAGGNKEILDSLGGKINITLKGSESTDADGQIVYYSWAKDGKQIATTPDIDLSLAVGDYEYVLTITDNDGATDADTVHVSIYNLNSTELWLESECTTVGSNWNTIESKDASNGKYLTVKPGVQSTAAASTDVNDLLVYNFHIQESGNFIIWARVLAPSYDDDSFWMKIDNGDWTNWNGLAATSGWYWNDIDAGGSTIVYPLDTGYHSLSVCYREDGAGIDKIYITNTGKVPSDMGGDATNCETEVPDTTNVNNSVALMETLSTVRVFPNPVKSVLNVESDQSFKTITIYNSSGQKILSKSYTTSQRAATLPLNLNNGVYVLQLISDSKVALTRFLIDR